MMNNMGGEDDLPDVDGADDVRIIQAIILWPDLSYTYQFIRHPII